MALAETQTLEVLLKFSTSGQGNITKVESQLAGLNTTAGKAGASTGVVTKGMSSVEKAAGSLGGALNHAKGAIGGLLTGPLGIIGLGAGLFTLGGAFAAGIGKAEDMALAVEKLSAVTGMSAHTASQYLAVFEKFGVDGAAATRSFGLLEKAIGLNTQTAKKATDFQAKYGIALEDSKGKALSAAQVFQELLAFENGNASASQKAAAAAALLGRNYVALLPVLKLGTAGFAEAAAEADKLGLTLKTAQDVTNVKAFIAAQRLAKDALAGLEVQLGLLIMPELTPALNSFTAAVSANKGQILAFFHDAIGFAKQVVSAVITIGGAFKSAWDAIPAPFRQLLLEGLVANKALKVVFGFDPLKIAEGGIASALKGLVGGFFGRGAPGNPMFVVQEGGAAGAVEGAAGAGGGLTAAGILASVGGGLAIAAAWKMLIQDPALNAQQRQVAVAAQHQLSSHPSAEAIRTGLASIRAGEKGIEAIPGGTFLYQGQYDFLKKLETLYAAAYKDTVLKGPKATPKAANDTTRKPRTAADLITKNDFADATKTGVTEGNRNLPDRRQADQLKLSIGLGLARLKDGVTTVERGGLLTVTNSVTTMANVIRGALTGGFDGVITAIHGISFPATVGGVPQLHNQTPPRRTGSGDLYTVPKPGQIGRGGGVPPPKTPHMTFIQVHASVTTRNVDSAGATQSRYGPTPTRAGAAVVLVG